MVKNVNLHIFVSRIALCITRLLKIDKRRRFPDTEKLLKYCVEKNQTTFQRYREPINQPKIIKLSIE